MNEKHANIFNAVSEEIISGPIHCKSHRRMKSQSITTKQTTSYVIPNKLFSNILTFKKHVICNCFFARLKYFTTKNTVTDHKTPFQNTVFVIMFTVLFIALRFNPCM